MLHLVKRGRIFTQIFLVDFDNGSIEGHDRGQKSNSGTPYCTRKVVDPMQAYAHSLDVWNILGTRSHGVHNIDCSLVRELRV